MAEGATVTVNESTWNRMKRERHERREHIHAGEKAAMSHFRGSGAKHGIMALGGAYAPVLKAVIAAGGLWLLATSDWVSKMEIFAKHWWLRGLLLVVGGIFAYRRGSSWGAGIAAAGAALLAADYKGSRGPAGEAKGPGEDTGYWFEGRWYEKPEWWGRREERERDFDRLPEGRRAAERMAERVFEHARAAA